MARSGRRRSNEPEWRRHLRFWGRDIDRDIDDELRFHLEMRQQDFLAAGMSPADARDAAMARFGDVDGVTRTLRDHDVRKQRRERRVEIMDALAQDIRYAARKLAQAPGFTIAVILVLALGIGVNSAIFSAVDRTLLSPLPFRDADRLAILERVSIPSRIGTGELERRKTSPDIRDVAALTDAVSAWGAYAPGGLNLGGRGEPIRVKVALATPGLFPLLGITPAAGRGFLEEEGRPGARSVAILSHALWQRQYGGDPAIVGGAIALNGTVHTVVGIMPPKFAFPAGTELWIPLTVPFTFDGTSREAIRSYLPSTIILKLAPGVTADDAGRRVRALFERYAIAERPVTVGPSELVMPLQQTLVRHRRTALLVLMGAAALVLLTACANVANLLLSRVATRRRELAVRTALGATRGRIVQQLLVESLLLAFAGGLAGIGVAYASLGLLTALLPAQLVDVIPPAMDLRVIAFSLGITTLTGLVFGLWPAFGATRDDVAPATRLSGGLAATAGDGARLRRLLVVSEMAFALMLLVGAGLMLRSFRALLATDTGVEVDRVASVELALPRAQYARPAVRAAFYDRLLEQLRATPGVEAAAAINQVPLQGEWGIGLSVQAEGKPPRDGEEGVYPQYLRVTPDYFRTMGIRIVAGRALTAQDDSLRPAAVINQAMAAKLWPGETPVGKRFTMGQMPGETPKYITVVGVVADVRSQSIEMEPSPQSYLPFQDQPGEFAGIVARGRGDPRAMLTALREAVRAVDPQQATYNLRTLDDAVAQTVAPRRTNTLLIAVFGLLSVGLSALGVYAVIAYGVAQRTREIGIRMALGATASHVLRMVLREGFALSLVGVAIGLGGAWALSRVMESLLYGVGARDPVVFVAAPALLLLLALAATFVPARRAARVNPMTTIRAE